jgi:hypothetical protein
VLSYSKSLKPSGWSWGGGGEGYRKVNSGFSRFGSGDGGMAMGNGGGSGILSHSSTVERLYAWEKKLFFEVKVGDRFLCSLSLAVTADLTLLSHLVFT